MNIFFLVLLGYMLFRFVANFLIPVFRTTRHVRQQFDQMRQPGPGAGQQSPGAQGTGAQPTGAQSAGAQPSGAQSAGFRGSQRAQSGPTASSTPNGARTPDASKVGEYIDFEEVKD